MSQEVFRDKVLKYRKATGHSQEELAEILGLHPTVLSNKLNGTNKARLVHLEVKKIILALAQWEAIVRCSQAIELLELVDLNQNSFSVKEWNSAPLNQLEDDSQLQELMVMPMGKRMPTGTNLNKSAPTLTLVPAFGETHEKVSSTQHEPKRERLDMVEAAEVANFYGRNQELNKLAAWAEQERCRLIAILGMGGFGKTTLAIKLVSMLKQQFDFVIWRSLKNAPKSDELVVDCIKFLSSHEQSAIEIPRELTAKFRLLTSCLRKTRSLIIFDNLETILQSGQRAGYYLPGFEAYGELFQLIAENNHQSCLVLTSREKPREIALLESAKSATRSLQLGGLGFVESRAILQDKALVGSESGWHELVKRYSGNPLALKLIAEPVHELYAGDIDQFLSENEPFIGDITTLLDQQFARLAPVEKNLIYWLAINREAITLEELLTDVVYSEAAPRKKEALEALEALGRRSLVERYMADRPTFTLQPLIMEYVTDAFTTALSNEIRQGELHLLVSHTLLKASAKAYILDSQFRFILQALAAKLRKLFQSEPHTALEEQLNTLLARLRIRHASGQGYAGGNLVNLVDCLTGDLSGRDFSGLVIRQAFLQGKDLQGTNFSGADLSGSVFTETFDRVLALAYRFDGKQLAIGCANGDIRIWQVNNGLSLVSCSSHAAPVRCIAFSPDGQLLASGGDNHVIKIWNTANGQALLTLTGHTARIRSLAFAPLPLENSPETDRTKRVTLLVSASSDGTIRLWNVTTGEQLKVWYGHVGSVEALAFGHLSSGEVILASAGDDKTVKLWDIFNSGTCLQTLVGHSDRVSCLAFSPDSSLLASGSYDQTIRLWQVDSGKDLAILKEHSHRVLSLDFSVEKDGRLVLASAGGDQIIKIWDVTTKRCFQTLLGHSDWVRAVAFEPNTNGQLLASGSDDQSVRFWSLNNGKCLRKYEGHTNWVEAITFNPKNNTLIAGGEDGLLRVWDVASGKNLVRLNGRDELFFTLAVTLDGNYLASGSKAHGVKLWDLANFSCRYNFELASQVRTLAFSPDGTVLICGSNDPVIELWSVETGTAIGQLKGHSHRVLSLTTFSSGSSAFVISGSGDGLVKIWDLTSRECLKTFAAGSNWVRTVAFYELTNGNGLVASGSDDHIVRVWDFTLEKCLYELKGHTDRVQAVAFQPAVTSKNQSPLLASGSEDGTIKLWDLKQGNCVKTLSGHSGQIRTLVFDTEGKMLASGSGDGTIRLWDVISGDCVKTFGTVRPYEGMLISGVSGLSQAQKNSLRLLGAIG